jgi:tetratricopeptide (TPR) repeat protein
MLYEEGDYETAFRYWERALAINPAFARARSNLVLAAARLHRTDLMDRYLLSMVRLYPSNPLVYSTYADWLASVGRFTEAVSLLDQAQQLDPQSEEIRQMRIGVLTRRDAADRILLFRILDADHNASLSPGEIVAAPAALLSLDRNGDGELTPEECGASFGDVSHLTPSALKAARVNFMRANPLLWALDSDHDGVISAAEIHNADKQLQQLDRNRDGSVESPETVPGYVYGAALRLMKRLDWNRNGRIDAEELNSEALRGLFATADLDKDGNISLGELTNDLFYRADRDRNGVVTRDELAAALREFEAALHRSPSGIEQ